MKEPEEIKLLSLTLSHIYSIQDSMKTILRTKVHLEFYKSIFYDILGESIITLHILFIKLSPCAINNRVINQFACDWTYIWLIYSFPHWILLVAIPEGIHISLHTLAIIMRNAIWENYVYIHVYRIVTLYIMFRIVCRNMQNNLLSIE